MRNNTRAKLNQLELRPSKQRGQNFLQDLAVVHSILQFGAPKAEDQLVEIGPGLGALTAELVKIKPDLTLIEVEARFAEELARRFPQAKVICADVREVDFASLGDNLVIFGNLPYSLSTDIVFHLIDSAAVISRAVLMLQKEFVERMAADPGGRDYGTLSIGCQLWAQMQMGPEVSGDKFFPPAKVKSRVLEMKFLKNPRVPLPDAAFFRKVVKASFLQRRRKLINSLKGSGLAEQELLDRALLEAGIDPGRRAETLSIEEFAKLARAVKCLIGQG